VYICFLLGVDGSLPLGVQTQKRDWIYAGLAHPSGVALARPAAKEATRVPVGSQVLLAGDQHVRGLSPTFKALCAGRGAKLITQVLEFPEREGTISQAADRIMVKSSEIDPQLVLVSIPWKSPVGSDELEAAARKLTLLRRRGRTVAWLRPPKRTDYTLFIKRTLDRSKMPSFHTEALQLPLGPDGATPTAEGYAGWAGALWRWLR
jgi:hypothetical protein